LIRALIFLHLSYTVLDLRYCRLSALWIMFHCFMTVLEPVMLLTPLGSRYWLFIIHCSVHLQVWFLGECIVSPFNVQFSTFPFFETSFL
jgi:hypothetical protein